MEGRQDIFNGRFGDQQEPKEDLSFSKGAGNIATGMAQIFKGFKHILLKKFPFNVLFLLLVIGVSVAGTYFLKPGVTGMVVQNVTQECPVCEETICPECVCEEEVCPECPVCEEKIVYRYRCTDGTVVDESSIATIECKLAIPEINSEYQSESNGVTLAINLVEYSGDEIRKINYTIINEGTKDIMPQISIKVYDQWNSDVINADYDKEIYFPKVLEVNDWITRIDELHIPFESDEEKIRLELKDALMSPPESIAIVSMEFR